MKKILACISAMLVAIGMIVTNPAVAAPPARKGTFQGLHCVRGVVSYSDITSNSAMAAKVIGTIPSGSIIVGSVASVTTAFTTAATVSLSIGSSTTTASESVMTNSTFSATAGRKLGVLSPVISSDTTYSVYTQAASYSLLAGGSADVVIFYYPHAN